MKRRDFTKGVLAAVGTGLAAADGRAPALAQEKVTLSFLHKWPEPQNIVFFQNAVSAFQTAHPNVTINMDAVADDPYKEKIRVAMASGEIPDVYFTWVGEYTRQFIRAGRVLDITQYLSAPAWQGRFAPATLDAYKTDGKIYGVPIEVDAKFMIYNKALFAKAGIDAPPAEWPTFAGALNKLKAAQITPISFGAQLAWATVHYIGDLNAKLVPSNVRLADYTLRAAPEKLFTDPGYVQSLTLYRDFLTNGWFNKSPDAYTHAAARASFVAGRAGMMYQELVEFGRIDGTKLAQDGWDFFPMPAIPDGHAAPGPAHRRTGRFRGFTHLQASGCRDRVPRLSHLAQAGLRVHAHHGPAVCGTGCGQCKQRVAANIARHRRHQQSQGPGTLARHRCREPDRLCLPGRRPGADGRQRYARGGHGEGAQHGIAGSEGRELSRKEGQAGR